MPRHRKKLACLSTVDDRLSTLFFFRQGGWKMMTSCEGHFKKEKEEILESAKNDSLQLALFGRRMTVS